MATEELKTVKPNDPHEALQAIADSPAAEAGIILARAFLVKLQETERRFLSIQLLEVPGEFKLSAMEQLLFIAKRIQNEFASLGIEKSAIAELSEEINVSVAAIVKNMEKTVKSVESTMSKNKVPSRIVKVVAVDEETLLELTHAARHAVSKSSEFFGQDCERLAAATTKMETCLKNLGLKIKN